MSNACLFSVPELESHLVFKIISSLKTVVGVRFSISREIFLGCAGYDELTSDRFVGRITRFANVKSRTLSIVWEEDGLTDVYSLHKLLVRAYGFVLMPMANGMGPPKLTGRALATEQVDARRRAEEAAAAAEEPSPEAPRYVDVPWTDGAVPRVQRWKVVAPEAIAVDVRAAAGHEDYGMKLKRVEPNPEPALLKTGYDFLFKWSVPPKFLTEFVEFMNERLDGKQAYTRLVTEGELVRHLSYTGQTIRFIMDNLQITKRK